MRVLILSQYSLPAHKRNMNAYQRLYYGSQHATIELLVRRAQEVSEELRERVAVHEAPFANRWLFLAYAIGLALRLRLRGCRVVITEPSGFAAVGFVAKYLGGYFWALDVWDRPRWRTGRHESGAKPPVSDRLVFWLMGHASLFLMSVLPRAAKDIPLREDRCLQLYNAIEGSLVADSIPPRRPEDTTLHLAYGRSEFQETMGIDVVIKAAEILHRQGHSVVIHLIGEMSPASTALVEASCAADLFRIHGFTQQTRAEFFRTIHVGLVPYLRFEDLSYIFPIKVLEHLSQGNPVIVSNLPGLCSMVQHEHNGLVVEPGDPAALAGAIGLLQTDYRLWKRLAENAMRSVRRFDAARKNREIFDAIRERSGA